jgi:diguanylate cyclase (GGDEF)-like protein
VLNSPEAPRGAWPARLADLVVGTHPSLRSRVSYGLHPILIYIAWCLVHAYSAHAGYMSVAAAKFMIVHNMVGMLAFYPLVRSGYSARFADSGLIQPQIMWAASSAIICYALNPPLRAALMQVLCFIHLFGLFTLRPRQLKAIAVATIGMLFLMLAVMTALGAPNFHVGHELFKVAFGALIIGLLTWMSILHARVRGRLSVQKKELASAVVRLNELVTRDVLTGLFNRMQMQQLLTEEVARQALTGKAFCVALIDLDHFKAINDQHGHHVGDEVLCRFARAAEQALREADIVARWGGEEFLVLMRETPHEADAKMAIDRVRASLASAAAPAFSFSAGVALHREGDTIGHVIEAADRALYAAKAGGRACTKIAPAQPA